MNTNTKNYGKDDLRKGDYVWVWGRGRTVFRVVKMSPVHGPSIEMAAGTRSRRGWEVDLSQLRLATDQEEAQIRFAHDRKLWNEQRRQELDEQKERTEKNKAVLAEFIAFCEQDPATSLDSELWQRLRDMDDYSRCLFVNADFREPRKWR